MSHTVSVPDVLITQHDIQTRVVELAAEIRRDFPGGVHFIAVLKGAVMFVSDLIRHLDGEITLDFMAVSSYAKGTSSGEVRLLKDLDVSLAGKDVIVVEDVIDTGITLTYLHHILRARDPRLLKTACLMNKPARRQIKVQIDYVGFTIENKFVVGYGLDYAERFRHLPYIGAIELPS